MKKYEEPKVEVIELVNADVVQASGCGSETTPTCPIDN